MSSYDFEELAALKPGDVFYECEMGVNIKVEVVSAPVRTIAEDLPKPDGSPRGVLEWDAKNAITGEPIHYMVTELLLHYGPRIYKEPQYVTIRGGELTYDLYGEEKTNG